MNASHDGPNAEQVRYWNDAFGARWVAQQEALDAQLAPYGERAIAALQAEPSSRVLDVGCGCGGTSLAIAQRVPQGDVLGVDISAPMLARARERAAGVANLRFEQGDAQIHAFVAGSVDRVFSRFGVMFFADPTAAFTNIGRALRSGGRLVFICWQTPAQNPWMTVPVMAAARHVALSPPPPNAPGPFAFADRDRVAGILQDAGFADVALDPFDPEMVIAGREIDDVVELLLQLGPVATALREHPDQIANVRAALHTAIAPHHRDGAVRMPSSTWVATARRA